MHLIRISGVDVDRSFIKDKEIVSWTAGMMIDADGSPQAYHPIDKKGLDAHSSAGYPNGGWRSILAAKTKLSPAYVQKEGDEAPGFFVSKTSYEHSDFNYLDTHRYVNASTVPYIVVPPQIRSRANGVVLGCAGTITYKGKTIKALVADIGPKFKIGEASIFAAMLLGIKSSPRTGGIDSHEVEYKIFPNIPAEIDGVKYKLIPVGK